MQALLTGGTTYLIVVSGYGSEAGPYQINVTATNGQAVSGLPIKGRYALAQSSCFASVSSNSTASGERRTLLTCKCQKRLKKKKLYIFSGQLRADQKPGPPREGQLMCTLFLSMRQ